MEALLLAIYSFFVWLVFFKFKWLPWNTVTQVIVIIIPVVGLSATILLLNVYAPSSSDVRVVKYTIQILPQVKGRVIEVPAEGNKPMRKGDVLFRIDPALYQGTVNQLEASLANAQGSSKELEEQLTGAVAQAAAARSGIEAAESRVSQSNAQVDLARKRVAQNRELVAKGAGNRFDLEQAETNLKELEGSLDGARSAEAQARSAHGQALAAERQIRQRMGAKAGSGEWAQVAEVRAKLDNARWELDQTTVYAPANGTPINVNLRPGAMTVPFPVAPALTFVEDEFIVVALYAQNELHAVAPGDEAEIALDTLPGEIIKASVDSIIWAQGQGQTAGVNLPQTAGPPPPPGKFPVKLKVDPKYRDVFLAAGARGDAAIYTQHLAAIHVLRKVIMRVGTKINYLILKLH